MAVVQAGLNREAIYAALAACLATVAGLTVSRRLPPSGQSGVLEQPCAFVPAGKELTVNVRGNAYSHGQPAVWHFDTVIFVYNRTDDPAAPAPVSLLTPLVQAIEASLRWKKGDSFVGGLGLGGWTNLGGLVRELQITSVEYAEGIPDGQGVAFIHVEMIAESPPA